MGKVPVTAVTVPLVGVTQVKPLEQVEQAERTCPLVPTVSSTGVETPAAAISEPLAVTIVGGITQAVLSVMVPEVVIVPPVKPVPAVIEVRVPLLEAPQAMPVPVEVST
jgi:hypothetical protein